MGEILRSAHRRDSRENVSWLAVAADNAANSLA